MNLYKYVLTYSINTNIEVVNIDTKLFKGTVKDFLKNVFIKSKLANYNVNHTFIKLKNDTVIIKILVDREGF